MSDKIKNSIDILENEVTKLPQDVLDQFLKNFQRHGFSARIDAHHSVRSIFDAGQTPCSRTDLIVLSGRDKTNRSGKAILPINKLLCGAASEGLPDTVRLVLIREPQCVVTPSSDTALFATAVCRSTPSPAPAGLLVDRGHNVLNVPALETVDVEVTIWRPDGTTAAETHFSWICTVEAGRRIFF